MDSMNAELPGANKGVKDLGILPNVRERGRGSSGEKNEKEQQAAEKVRAAIESLGLGEVERVNIVSEKGYQGMVLRADVRKNGEETLFAAKIDSGRATADPTVFSAENYWETHAPDLPLAQSELYAPKYRGYYEPGGVTVMEYVEGVPIGDELREGFNGLGGLKLVLQQAHWQYLLSQGGLVNLDPKGDNYLLEPEGKMRVLDMGGVIKDKNQNLGQKDALCKERVVFLEMLAAAEGERGSVIREISGIQEKAGGNWDEATKEQLFEVGKIIKSKDFARLPEGVKVLVLAETGLYENAEVNQRFTSRDYQRRLLMCLEIARREKTNLDGVPSVLAETVASGRGFSVFEEYVDQKLIPLPEEREETDDERRALKRSRIERFAERPLTQGSFFRWCLSKNMPYILAAAGEIYTQGREANDYGARRDRKLGGVSEEDKPSVHDQFLLEEVNNIENLISNKESGGERTETEYAALLKATLVKTVLQIREKYFKDVVSNKYLEPSGELEKVASELEGLYRKHRTGEKSGARLNEFRSGVGALGKRIEEILGEGGSESNPSKKATNDGLRERLARLKDVEGVDREEYLRLRDEMERRVGELGRVTQEVTGKPLDLVIENRLVEKKLKKGKLWEEYDLVEEELKRSGKAELSNLLEIVLNDERERMDEMRDPDNYVYKDTLEKLRVQVLDDGALDRVRRKIEWQANPEVFLLPERRLTFAEVFEGDLAKRADAIASSPNEGELGGRTLGFWEEMTSDMPDPGGESKWAINGLQIEEARRKASQSEGYEGLEVKEKIRSVAQRIGTIPGLNTPEGYEKANIYATAVVGAGEVENDGHEGVKYLREGLINLFE